MEFCLEPTTTLEERLEFELELHELEEEIIVLGRVIAKKQKRADELKELLDC